MTRRDDAAPAERRAIHVTMIERRWAVVRFGDRDPLSSHDQKLDAIVEARRIAAKDGVEVVIFDLGGRPLPPDASVLGT